MPLICKDLEHHPKR